MTTPNDNLSRAASAVLRIQRQHAEGAYWDAGFDGGEWSGPSHGRMEAVETAQAVRDHGFTVDSYNKALTDRCGAKWAHIAGVEVTA